MMEHRIGLTMTDSNYTLKNNIRKGAMIAFVYLASFYINTIISSLQNNGPCKRFVAELRYVPLIRVCTTVVTTVSNLQKNETFLLQLAMLREHFMKCHGLGQCSRDCSPLL